MNNKIIYCGNCGKQGHVFHSCKLPIISNGLIVYREKNTNGQSSKSNGETDTNKFEYLMIKRKDTWTHSHSSPYHLCNYHTTVHQR